MQDLVIVTTSMLANISLDKSVRISSGLVPLQQLDGTRTFYMEGVKLEQRRIDVLNTLLDAIFPGTRLSLEIVDTTFITFQPSASRLEKALYDSINYHTGYITQVVSCHKDSRGMENHLPLSSESEGFRRIVAILNLYLRAYFNPSVTLVIDEIDNGIFEYFLSTMIELFNQYGKGQLIFTCHNLGPIERITKTIYFTTPDPDNRYAQIKNIHATNNLRKMYLGSLERGEQLFWNTTKDKIIESLNSLQPTNQPVSRNSSYTTALITDVNYSLSNNSLPSIGHASPHIYIQAKLGKSSDFIIFDLFEEIMANEKMLPYDISSFDFSSWRGREIAIRYDSEHECYTMDQHQANQLLTEMAKKKEN